MQKHKKISIIIPLYNGEKYIKDTIESILMSSYNNLEILIINDGSTDNSIHICKELQKKDDRIFIYSKENEGIVSSRNYGLSKTTGEYLCFCDQDDLVDKNCYLKQISQMEIDQSEICMCSTGRNINGKLSAYELSEDACFKDAEITEHLLYPLLFNGFSVPIKMDTKNRYPHIWSCMFRTSFWQKHQLQFRSYINYEDDLLLKVEAFSKAKKISTLSYIGYYWRVNLKSESYGHKYIENISNKQQCCFDDLYKSITEKVKDPKALELFRQVTLCKQYLDAIHNLVNLSKITPQKHIKQIIRAYFDESIYQRDFENCIQARKYTKKGRIKPFVILSILSKKWTLLSYYSEIILDYILLFTLHSPTLTKLERLMKGIHLM